MTQDSVNEFQTGIHRTLSNPIQLESHYILRRGPRCVIDITQALGRPASVISHHSNVPRNVDIEATRRYSQEIVYQVASSKIIPSCDLMREAAAAEVFHHSGLVQGLSIK